VLTAYYEKPEDFSYFKKAKMNEFLAISCTISLNKGLLNTSSHLC